MRTERDTAIRLLQLLMAASLLVPAALFAYAAYSDYRSVDAMADERIGRSLDVLQEQALKVFQTVDRVFPEVNEVVRGLSDADIRAAQPSLTPRLARIAGVMPQIGSIVIVGADGEVLAASDPRIAQSGENFARRDFFTAPAQRDDGTYLGDVEAGGAAGSDAADSTAGDFYMSRRLQAAAGSFRGVIAVAVRPRYFADFYSMIEQAPGNFYALVRTDGAILARSPASGAPQRRALTPHSRLRSFIGQGIARGLFSADSEIDGRNRRFGFRALPGYPVYAVAGIDSAAIRAQWLGLAGRLLIFGLPATLLLSFTVWVALRGTRRLHDEADRREFAEDALRQAQRLEAIGQLTGGVAHDFNNLLMIVSGTAQRLRRHVAGDDGVRLLDAIAAATARGESLTRQLLAFSRRQTHQPSVIDLTERLPAIRDMLSRSLRGDIDIRLDLPRRPCAVKVDPGEFELAVLNLAFNARDAMPDGGTLTIGAKPMLLRGASAEEGLSGDYVAISVADTGSGIPPDVLPRVFEPFFTTKEVGKGTGLGLSQVYGFARQSGGAASISTSSRRGTSVTMFLPRCFETAAQPARQPATAAAPPHAGTVLVVEDNADVAAVAAAYFEELGYRVRRAPGARAALDALGEGGIDLVFSDILMPGGMNGVQLAETVRRRHPGVAVLLTTGYSSSAQDAVRRGFQVLQKPYDLAALERALSQARGGGDDDHACPQPREAVG